MDLKEFFTETVYDAGPYRRPQKFKYSVLSPLMAGNAKSYHGTLMLEENGIPNEITVKRLSTSASNFVRLSAIVESVGEMHHPNVQQFLGWCDERGQRLLVYKYMPNGSLSEHLHPQAETKEASVLPWSVRLKILCGVARALAYLHEGWKQRAIHRDVNPSNIMLDADFNAHLCNFDGALFCKHDEVRPSSGILFGTVGYVDPHYPQFYKPTEKSDVYGFGITLLEVATGRRPIMMPGNLQLVDWVRSLYALDDLLKAVDPMLNSRYHSGEMIMLLKMGLLCCHPQPHERPDGCCKYLERVNPISTVAADCCITRESFVQRG